MPKISKRKKLVKVKKPRSAMRKKRTRTRRRIKTFRKKRRYKWYKKFSKNSTYKFKHSQGIKWTSYMSIADFITLPYISFIQNVLGAAFGKQYDTGKAYTNTFISQSKILLGQMLPFYSTDDMQVNSYQIPYSDAKTGLNWKAWNPFLCERTLGPYFRSMISMYNKFKYVGVRLKWIPTSVPVTQFTYDRWKAEHNGSTLTDPFNRLAFADGTSTGPLLIDVTTQGESMIEDLSATNYMTLPTNLNLYNGSQFAGWRSTPNIKLWINVKKQGYEQQNILTEAQRAGNGWDETKTIAHSRFITARIFDDSGNRNDNDTVRCFDLSKPFKMYFRPKCQTVMREATIGADPLSNVENIESLKQQNIFNKIPDSDALLTSAKNYPWASVNAMYPTTYPYFSQFDDVDVSNTQAYVNTVGKGFVDPVLFGYCFSVDGLPLRSVCCPFQMLEMQQPDRNAYQGRRIVLYPIEYLYRLGKFKVTFYCKFKGMKGSNYKPSLSEAQRNADMEVEDPTLL